MGTQELAELADRLGLQLIGVRTGWCLYDPVTKLVTGPPWLPMERAEKMTLEEVERALTELDAQQKAS